MDAVNTNMSQEFALNLLDHFSIITVGKNKIPNFPWKPQQTEKLSREQLFYQLRHNTTQGLGIVTGFGNLEVIDIDTKILRSEDEKKRFENHFFAFVRDNFEDFDDKISIYRTVSGGLHLLYKCSVIEGNKKLATPKGFTEALFETRGANGFVMVYKNNQVGKLSYFQIKEITPEEREILMIVAKSYHYNPHPIEQKIHHVRKPYNGETLSAWDDFNNRTNIWDLLQHEFTIVSKNSRFTTIKRHGAKSAWSGYIYHDNNLLKLFSTATRYTNDSRKNGCLSAFDVYAIQNHGGDSSKAAKELYHAGYGERRGKSKKAYHE